MDGVRVNQTCRSSANPRQRSWRSGALASPLRGRVVAAPSPPFWPCCWGKRSPISRTACTHGVGMPGQGRAHTHRSGGDDLVCAAAGLDRPVVDGHPARTINATSLSAQFVGLAICVVDRGGAIPVAWTIRPTGQKRAWRRAWLRMVRQRRPAIPPDWTVLVRADRGAVRPLAVSADRAVARASVPAYQPRGHIPSARPRAVCVAARSWSG